MKKNKIELDTTGLSEKNKWFADSAQALAETCEEHGRGVIIIPFTHLENLNETDGGDDHISMLACTLSPIEAASAILGFVNNYSTQVLHREQAKAWQNTIADSIKELKGGIYA